MANLNIKGYIDLGDTSEENFIDDFLSLCKKKKVLFFGNIEVSHQYEESEEVDR